MLSLGICQCLFGHIGGLIGRCRHVMGFVMAEGHERCRLNP